MKPTPGLLCAFIQALYLCSIHPQIIFLFLKVHSHNGLPERGCHFNLVMSAETPVRSHSHGTKVDLTVSKDVIQPTIQVRLSGKSRWLKWYVK